MPPNLFDFEERAPDSFHVPAQGGPLLRLFGGHVLAQALSAAQRTVAPGRLAHSLHAYFIRAGLPDLPIDYNVARYSDGRSFSSRRVEAMQGGKIILCLLASMHDDEPGAVHQIAMPDVPPPEDLTPQDDIIAEALPHMPPLRYPFWNRDLGIDYRAVEPFITVDPPVSSSRRHFWVRMKERLGDDPTEHQRMLTYLSDLYLMHTGLGPLGIGWADHRMQDASLDHALWFHQRFRADEWLLYAMDSPYAGGARTLGCGTIFAQDGRVVASVAQEGLIRILPPGGSGA
ncbi:acyl-CoA thioesterase II [Nostoc sp. 3335mG]|nr:acyl-CoA thioesterase II [Nostoc sp. 3335mG]